MANIKLKNIAKKFKSDDDDYEVIAVSDFNLEIKSGESIVFLGPSGCGKTTTLRMIAGLETISEGEFYIDGKLVNDVLPCDRGISMVFHDYAVFPHMTAFENIAFGLQPCDLSEDEIKAKVEETARILDITHLLERKPRAISGGQKQRVAIARALVSDNEIVLFDEPYASLDERLRFYMRTEIAKLHTIAKKTFIHVTSQPAEAMELGDRIVVMRDGMIEQDGTPRNLYTNPINMFVAGFIGHPQMNFLDGTLTECDGNIFFSWGSHKIKLPQFNEKQRDYIGKKVYIGIRSEHVYADEANLLKYKDCVIEAEVRAVKFYGLAAYIQFGDEEIMASIPEEYNVDAKAGDIIKFTFDPDKIYLFDPDTEKVIEYKA